MSDPILARLEAGTLIRNAWTGTDAQGRATACLLAALAPECGAAESSAACPAEVMPAWLAPLTVFIDDSGSLTSWLGHVRRYAAIAPRFGELIGDLDRRALIGCLRVIVAEAPSHGEPSGAVSAVLALLDREIGGDRPTAAEYASSAAAASASAAAEYASAASSAASAAEYAAYAAYAAAEYASASAAAVAAEYATHAAYAAAYAAYAAYAANAAANAAYAAANAAYAASSAAYADRIIDGILFHLESLLSGAPPAAASVSSDAVGGGAS